jgi:hypothetical protein
VDRWRFYEAVKFDYPEMALTCLVRRDIFLEAFLRWIAPLLAAFWITGIAVVKAARAFSADCSSMAARTLLNTFNDIFYPSAV